VQIYCIILHSKLLIIIIMLKFNKYWIWLKWVGLHFGWFFSQNSLVTLLELQKYFLNGRNQNKNLNGRTFFKLSQKGFCYHTRHAALCKTRKRWLEKFKMKKKTCMYEKLSTNINELQPSTQIFAYFLKKMWRAKCGVIGICADIWHSKLDMHFCKEVRITRVCTGP
jgi:hypothetical protein